jgi:signal transduction histidine kinase/DNA-binding response OmpR family regulator/ligand-binding sensor domain-containing protein
MLERLISIIYLTILISGCWPEPAWGQSVHLPFEQISVEDQLPNPSVLEFWQDDEGLMWIGTFSGIARYDGYQMKVYHPGYGNRDSLPSRDLPIFFQDREQRLWLGLSYQDCPLYLYNPEVDQFEPFEFDTLSGKGLIPDFTVTSIIQDHFGRLLLGTLDGGLFVLQFPEDPENDVQLTQYLHDPSDPYSLVDNSISGKMSADDQGNIWIPTEGGLCKWNPKTRQFKTLPFTLFPEKKFGNRWCHTTLFTPPHTMWVGTKRNGLLQIDTRNDAIRYHLSDPSSPYSYDGTGIFKIAKGENQTLWVLSNGYSYFNLYRMETTSGRFFPVRDRNYPNRQFVASEIFTDYSGNLWIGSWQEGIFKFDPKQEQFQFLQFPKKDYLKTSPAITAVGEDHQGRIWLGTMENGIAAWNIDQQEFSEIYSSETFPAWFSNNPVFGLEEAAPDHLFIGSHQGLLQLNPSTQALTKISEPEERFGRLRIWPVDSTFWWATDFWGKVFALDPRSGLINHPIRPDLTVPSIVSFAYTDTSIWIGDNQFGLFESDLENGKTRLYLRKNGIHEIYIDSSGIAWLATHSAGLKALDIHTKQLIELPEEMVEAIGLCRKILPDDEGMLWTITAQGIIQFDPKKRVILQSYKASNWVQTDAPWYNQISVGKKLSDGRLIFGSASGALVFHPDSLKTDTVQARIALTEFQLFNKPLSPGPNSPLSTIISRTHSIHLSHYQNDIALTFAATLFKNTATYRYRYRLTPLEKEWVEAGARNTAYYTELEPGKYHFEVQTANAAGQWIESGRKLQLTISKPWWETWAARFVYVALLFVLIWIIYRILLQRAEAKRLRELDALKTRLYTNITHEFRTPLTLILGLADQLKTNTSKQVQGATEVIERNGRQLLRMVNHLLELAKLDSGNLPLEPVQDDVIPYLKYLVDSFQSLATQKKIQLRFSSSPDQLILDFDPEKLQQIVSNLISNALKFTPENGEVELWLFQKNAGLYTIRITDTGVGIEQEELERIFDRFYQADSSMTRKAEGTGVGLSLTKELIRLMGGTISVESKLEKGATFTIQLPISNKAPIQPAGTPLRQFPNGERLTESPIPESPAQAEDARPMILIVEDNADVRNYIRACLQEFYRVEESANGLEGFQMAQSLVPDLIISDIMMPQLDGFELCRKVKQTELTGHIPVVLLTAKTDETSRLLGLELGAEAYLPKPFSKAELLIRIKKLLELRQQLKKVYQQMILQSPPETNEKSDPGQLFLQRVRQIIEEQLEENVVSVQELATQLGMGRTQLHRKFTQMTEYSPSRFIRLVQIQKARYLIEKTDHPVASVAYKCGFSDPDYFSKVFKQETGNTPSKHRKKYQS